jgi:predicted nucleic-acid-binding protein
VIALDTNVLVRLAMADDADQTRRAARLLTAARSADERLFVPDIVLCELAWVLARTYGLDRDGVAEVVRGFLDGPELAFRDATAISDALAALQKGDGDFADHLIAAAARAAGCEAVATFDRALQKLPGFRPA